MKKLIISCLFIIGLSAALFTFINFQGLGAKGNFETIVLDFKQTLSQQVLQQDLQEIAQKYNVTPQLDNKLAHEGSRVYY